MTAPSSPWVTYADSAMTNAGDSVPPPTTTELPVKVQLSTPAPSATPSKTAAPTEVRRDTPSFVQFVN
ncbi:hypothetical protein VAR608DRAFT_0320 [Variovorax sp. HW608]|nr:hypothetical protein VAR608DRAFT_0320 [Variovorax sp. HW608]